VCEGSPYLIIKKEGSPHLTIKKVVWRRKVTERDKLRKGD